MNPVGDESSMHVRINTNIQTFRNIEEKYTSLLAEKNYDKMAPDIIEYSNLYDKISNMVLYTKDKQMKLLFKITQQGLAGAIHAFHLNAANVDLQLKTTTLQTRVNTILSDKNLSAAVMDSNNETISLVKTVTLAPLYSYYILLFGAPNDGFDPVKIQQILHVLQQYNIDPFE
jgi:hypothetical protein